MSQIITMGSGGGGTPITKINGDIGSVSGATISFTGLTSAGSTVSFNGAGTAMTLQVSNGNQNITMGAGAGNGSISGTGNTIIGSLGGVALASGSSNIGVGQNVLGRVSSGSQNAGMGEAACFAVTGGAANIGIGFHALYAGGGVGVTTGNFNVAVGDAAGSSYTGSESNNVLLNAAGVIGESNTFRVGNGSGTGNQQINRSFIAGIAGVTVSSAQMVTVNTSTGQLGSQTIPTGILPWSVITANQTASVNNGYFINKAGTLTLALPATSAVGDIIEVVNINTATGTQFTQAAGQQILLSTASTTLGATGTLTSSSIGDSIKLVCRTANTTWWASNGMIGNWTSA